MAVQDADQLKVHTFSLDIVATILVYQNNETTLMLAFQTNPVGDVKLFSDVNTFF